MHPAVAQQFSNFNSALKLELWDKEDVTFNKNTSKFCMIRVLSCLHNAFKHFIDNWCLHPNIKVIIHGINTFNIFNFVQHDGITVNQSKCNTFSIHSLVTWRHFNPTTEMGGSPVLKFRILKHIFYLIIPIAPSYFTSVISVSVVWETHLTSIGPSNASFSRCSLRSLTYRETIPTSAAVDVCLGATVFILQSQIGCESVQG